MQLQRKKLNLSVKKEFQKWLLIRILGTVTLCSLLAACILYLYARNEIVSSFYDAHIQIRRVSDLLLPVIAAGSIVSLISGTLLALFLPQKIAGPIYRIEQDLKSVDQGDLTTTIRLRHSDTLKDLAVSINQTTSSLRTKILKIKESHAKVESSLASDNRDALIKSIRQHKEDLDVIKT